MTTRQPACASSSATRNPSPREPPVTTATRPRRSYRPERCARMLAASATPAARPANSAAHGQKPARRTPSAADSFGIVEPRVVCTRTSSVASLARVDVIAPLDGERALVLDRELPPRDRLLRTLQHSRIDGGLLDHQRAADGAIQAD